MSDDAGDAGALSRRVLDSQADQTDTDEEVLFPMTFCPVSAATRCRCERGWPRAE